MLSSVNRQHSGNPNFNFNRFFFTNFRILGFSDSAIYLKKKISRKNIHTCARTHAQREKERERAGVCVCVCVCVCVYVCV